MPSSVLFCCDHNAIRSPIAEGLAKLYYGKKIFISLIDFIRDEKKFDGIENLKEQIVMDVKLSESILEKA